MIGLPSAQLGIAPPPMGGPMATPGPVSEARKAVVEAAKSLFRAIELDPTQAKGLNEIIEKLTDHIRELSQPPDALAAATAGPAGPPALDRTPTGPPGSMAGGGAPGGNPAGILAQLMGGMR